MSNDTRKTSGRTRHTVSQRKSVSGEALPHRKSIRLIVGHLKRNGMLACILSEANPEMETVYL